MMTEVDEGLVSGIRGIEWDAVELPSQASRLHDVKGVTQQGLHSYPEGCNRLLYLLSLSAVHGELVL